VSPELYDKIHYDFNFLTNDHFRHVAQHQMLGYMWSIQGLSMDEDETLLIQFDTDYWEAGFQWGDGECCIFRWPKLIYRSVI
jgi:hypothetical protein